MRFLNASTLAFAIALVTIASSSARADVQEVFVCTLNEGKTMEDLMKVADEFKAAIQNIEGGKDYSATILTPIASQDMDTVIWVGRMPSFPAMAAFNDAYGASEVSEDLSEDFEDVSDCQSRSFWRIHDVK